MDASSTRARGPTPLTSQAAADGGLPEPPPHLVCAVSLHLLRDPVILPTGFTYERWAIERHLRARAEAGQTPTDPMSGAELQSVHLTPNVGLRHAAEAWLDDLRQRDPEAAVAVAREADAARPVGHRPEGTADGYTPEPRGAARRGAEPVHPPSAPPRRPVQQSATPRRARPPAAPPFPVEPATGSTALASGHAHPDPTSAAETTALAEHLFRVAGTHAGSPSDIAHLINNVSMGLFLRMTEDTTGIQELARWPGLARGLARFPDIAASFRIDSPRTRLELASIAAVTEVPPAHEQEPDGHHGAGFRLRQAIRRACIDAGHALPPLAAAGLADALLQPGASMVPITQTCDWLVLRAMRWRLQDIRHAFEGRVDASAFRRGERSAFWRQVDVELTDSTDDVPTSLVAVNERIRRCIERCCEAGRRDEVARAFGDSVAQFAGNVAELRTELQDAAQAARQTQP